MIQHEQGRVVIRHGIDEQGDEVFDFSVEGLSAFEAWAGTHLVAELLHDIVVGAFSINDEDEGDDSGT